MAVNPVRRFALNVLTSGTYDLYDPVKRSRLMFLNTIMLVGILFLFAFSAIAFSNGETPLGLSTLSCGFFIVIVFLLTRLKKIVRTGSYFIVTLIFLLFGYLFVSGGSGGSGFLWAYTYPLAALFLLGRLAGSFYSLIFWAGMTAFLFVPALSPAGMTLQYAARISGVYLLVYAFTITYESVRVNAQKRLERANAELSRTTASLLDEKRRRDTIFDHIDQGILLLGSDLAILPSYSAFLKTMFRRDDLAGLSFVELLRSCLQPRDLAATEDFLGMFFKEDMNPDLLKEINPLESVALSIPDAAGGPAEKKNLTFFFGRIVQEDGTKVALVLIADITGQVVLQEQLKEEQGIHEKNMENLFQIIHVDPKMMTEFIEDGETEIDDLNAVMKKEQSSAGPVLEAAFQSVHALKGNSAALGLKNFSQLCHRVEDSIKEIRAGKPAWEDLLSVTIQIGSLQQELSELKVLIQRILSFQASSDDASKKGGLLVRTLSRLMAGLCEKTGKKADLAFDHFDSDALPSRYRRLAKDVCIQMLRNAMTHGIEKPEERLKRNKPERGVLSIGLWRAGDRIVLSFRDDGRGLDLAGIRKTARADAELAAKADGLTPSALVPLIFRPGFSTSADVSMEAGRGVGMSLVKSRVETARGSIKVRTATGKYTEFEISLPAN